MEILLRLCRTEETRWVETACSSEVALSALSATLTLAGIADEDPVARVLEATVWRADGGIEEVPTVATVW